MRRTEQLQGLRMLKPKHVLSGREAGRLSQIEAAEILGMSEQTFRRWLPLGLLIAAVAAA